MGKRIKILHLEDSLKDFELINSIIKNGEIKHTYFLTDNKKDFVNILHTEDIDIILADYNLPDYSGNEALKFTKEKYSSIPFIFLSGTIGEDAAINAMLNGATDYVLKNKLERLVPAIKRAVNEKEQLRKQKKIEKSFHDSEEKFQYIMENSADAIFIANQQAKYIYTNKKVSAMLGYTSEEMKSKSIADITNPTKHEEIFQLFNQVLNEGKSYSEIELLKKDGNYISTDLNAVLLPDGMVYVGCRDITERKKVEFELIKAKEKAEESQHNLRLKNEELLERNTFIQTILDNLPIGLALNTINEGEAIYMNKKFQEIYGWTSNEINSIASFFEKAFPDKEYREQLIESVMADINSGDPQRMHWENLYVTQKDGSKRVVNAVNIPLLKQNTMVSTAIDITALHQIQSDLIKAKEKAEESDRLKSAFLANMSHEVRTPLNSIIGFSELLADPAFEVNQKNEFLQHIINAGNNLLNIISDILDISRMESGEFKIRRDQIHTQKFISGIKEQFIFQTETKKLELKLTLPETKEVTFTIADPDRLSQIFNNLVGNALKFTAKGSIEIGYHPYDQVVEFYVRDTGIGIPAKYHVKIFDRFRQVEDASSRKYGGNGLGLAITKNLVELMGGKIWVESEPGHGSTFYFTLPSEDESIIKITA